MAKTEQEAARGHQGPPPPYMQFEIDATLHDAQGDVVEQWVDRQELVIDPPNIFVRRTRRLPDGREIVYEDRGTINQAFQISGKSGFGGEWRGRVFPGDGLVFTEGIGGKAEFKMTSWTLDEKEQACLRVLDVKDPVAFLTEKPLAPGRYYVRTADHLRSVSNEVPDAMKKPLS